jgi:hypothetical protein
MCAYIIKKRAHHFANQSIRPWEHEELRSLLPHTSNNFINGHHVLRIFTDVPGMFLISVWPNICQHLSLPLIAAISVQGRCCTHVISPEYSTIHIDQLPPDITGIATGDEIFFGDKDGFSTYHKGSALPQRLAVLKAQVC